MTVGDPGDRSAEALALVRAGWDHVRLQRPLAAWAAWRQALRAVPEDRAATEALDVLESAEELPAAARVPRAFRSPKGDARRAIWSERFRGRDLADLARATEAFAELSGADPGDSAAAFNLALGLAWLGRNAEALDALGRSVAIDAEGDPEAAVASWTLAEVLRLGAGAETLADDLSHTLTLEASGGDALARLGSRVPLRAVTVTAEVAPGTRVAEWLEGPIGAWSAYRGGRALPRVLATVIARGDQVQFASPDLPSLMGVEPILHAVLGEDFRPIDRRSTPLPLRFADAAAWLFRTPQEAPGEDEATLAEAARRAAIERYYEQIWIARPRIGLADDAGQPRTPAEASRGGASDRAKLAGVVAFREQLAARPRMAAIVEGYPFDRLRRRLGLPIRDEGAIDRADVSSMGREELERLAPTALAPDVLTEAHRAALAVCDPATVAEFEAEMASRRVSDP